MKAIIDTSSLLSLVRYYLPFDADNTFFAYIKQQIEKGDIIVVDEVLKESTFTAKQLVIKKLPYFSDKSFGRKFNFPYKTEGILPPSNKKFYNMVNDNFRTTASKRLNEAQFEQRKTEFLISADARMILLALNKKQINKDITIITEESETANDQKAFKKIPAICKILDIKVMTLPEFINKSDEIKITFK